MLSQVSIYFGCTKIHIIRRNMNLYGNSRNQIVHIRHTKAPLNPQQSLIIKNVLIALTLEQFIFKVSQLIILKFPSVNLLKKVDLAFTWASMPTLQVTCNITKLLVRVCISLDNRCLDTYNYAKLFMLVGFCSKHARIFLLTR